MLRILGYAYLIGCVIFLSYAVWRIRREAVLEGAGLALVGVDTTARGVTGWRLQLSHFTPLVKPPPPPPGGRAAAGVLARARPAAGAGRRRAAARTRGGGGVLRHRHARGLGAGGAEVRLVSRASYFRARAPLRISQCGGGTDVSPYPEEHGGMVLSMGQFMQWVGAQVQSTGTVQIWPGTPAKRWSRTRKLSAFASSTKA